MEVMNPRSLNEIKEEKQADQDKDLIIADLMQQVAALQQQVNDMSMIIVEQQLSQGGSV